VDQEARESAFQSALVTEHFVLQSAASTTVSEASSRASLYMVTLSSALVALGFTSQSDTAFGPFLAVVIPTVVLLGIFTVVRLVDTGVENLQFLRSMANIRAYYRELTPDAAPYFPVWGRAVDVHNEALAMIATKPGWGTAMSTTAAMINAVNSVLAGAGTALLLHELGLAVALGVIVGIAVAGGLMAAFLHYQNGRYLRLAATGNS
jgi:hypothetical protein